MNLVFIDGGFSFCSEPGLRPQVCTNKMRVIKSPRIFQLNRIYIFSQIRKSQKLNPLFCYTVAPHVALLVKLGYPKDHGKSSCSMFSGVIFWLSIFRQTHQAFTDLHMGDMIHRVPSYPVVMRKLRSVWGIHIPETYSLLNGEPLRAT